MRAAVLSFAVGIAWLQFQPVLPQVWMLFAVAAAGLALAGTARFLRRGRLVMVGLAMLLLGVAWAGGRAQVRLAEHLAESDEGRDIEVIGVVAGLPQPFDRGVRFTFDVERSPIAVPAHVALAWYGGSGRADEGDEGALPDIRVGQRWQLTVRLKRPHGSLNPHGFDYEAWLFERNLRATGYVRKSERNIRLDEQVVAPLYVVEWLRQSIRERFMVELGDRPYAGILVALAIGDQRAIDTKYWRTFARTGVTHLLSVSGLHVTMVAGLVAWLAGFGWRRVPALALRVPTPKVMAAVGFFAALGYALLAGFEIPAQRTLIMLGVVAVAVYSSRNIAASRVLAAALFVVLLLDPWAVLAAGFWLSFAAVALLFYIDAGRLRTGHWLAIWGRAQWAITLGLIPALLALFQQFSLASPLANAVAIPLVSLVITPLTLLAMLPFAAPLLAVPYWLTEHLMGFLQWLAAFDWAVWQQQAPPAWAVAMGAFGVVWLLLPNGFPARWLGAAAMLPLILFPAARPETGSALLRVLDVGQGLAVHVQTANHDLLYDAGPVYSEEADAGDRIVVPYLRALGVRRLDMLMISHQDRDHEGGAAAVLTALPVGWLGSSLPADHPLLASETPHRPCMAGQSWEWDGVRFEVLHPLAVDYQQRNKSNDMSCVLRVSTRHGSALLTGDIEAKSEAGLRARAGDSLASEVLMPPHHGSRSSSSPDFVSGVSPRLTFFSAGYRNRFGHPAPEVVERYEAMGSEIHRTDREGALVVELGNRDIPMAVERTQRRRYWHDG